MSRSLNAAGLELIRSFEQCRFDSYQDAAGIWTIGYGHTQGVGPKQCCSPEEAETLLEHDLVDAEDAVDAQTETVATTDNQFAAMVALAFNIGATAFRASSVLVFHRLGRHAEAADAFLRWDKAHVNGVLVTLPGLLARRQAERALYLAPGV